VIKDLLYICGAPATGKSTLMRQLRLPWDMEIVKDPPVPHMLLRSPVTGAAHGLELGVPRETHPGTDSLAMDISHRASDFLLRTPVGFALGEGARLATRPFLTRIAEAGVRVLLIYMYADDSVLDQRCTQRGTTQNYSWRKGAYTRAFNLATWARDMDWINYYTACTRTAEPGTLADRLLTTAGLEFLSEGVSA
jgi:hypothetical protein